MKTSQRHQLKHNEVTETLQQAYRRLEQNRKVLATVVAAILIVGAGVGATYYYQSMRDSQASGVLAEAMAVADAQVVPPAQGLPGQPPPPPPPAGSYPSDRARMEAALPKFIAVADAYPTTDAGLWARYKAGASLAALDRVSDARAQYQMVLDADGRGLYGRMARLALAQCDLHDKNYDAAINSLRELSLDAKGDLPIDSVLVQLGQAYLAAGKTTEARQAFERVTTEFATSPYAADAKKQLDAIKMGA
jgi:predicted negative regulator of RcsB-dependent stress response